MTFFGMGGVPPRALRNFRYTLKDNALSFTFPKIARKFATRLRGRANSLTAAEIEAAMHQTARFAVGLDGDSLATLTIEFQQTLRIPDDGKTHPLPAGLGRLPAAFGGRLPRDRSGFLGRK